MALTQVDQGMLGTNAQYTGFKNRIINGGMAIDQRNAGASVTVNSTTQTFSVDRWWASGQSTDGVFTMQQSSTAPSGFSNSTAITVTTADASIGTTQRYYFAQRIEGFNTADLGWGTAGASTVTLSFWVRSSITGTFGGFVYNSDADYSYPFSYTISSANTWEQKSVTIAGPTAGTWVGATNGVGMQIGWSLGTGTDRLGTSGAWTASQKFGATGQTNLIATSGATFYLTGVQLEKGSTATSFDYRPYTTELQLCQRYYINYGQCGLIAYSTQGVVATVSYPVTMRASPTVSISYNGVANTVYTIQTGATGVITPSIFGTAQGITNFYFLSGSWATGAGTGLATNVVASIEL
jgi:hypothetical protein